MAALYTGSLPTAVVCGIATDMVNLICTPMIVGRLWWLGSRGKPEHSRSVYNDLVVGFIESSSLYTITQIVYIDFTFTPGYFGISTFLTYVFTMVVAIAPMLLVLHLNTTVNSEMHVVEFKATDDNDKARPPQKSVGIVSTTIAFRPQPPTLSFGTELANSPTASATSSDKSTGIWQEKAVDEENSPTARSVGIGTGQEAVS
ncbi:hypothetical protein FRB93_005775 [Tulasnella sp. JGI-2019a]|nr:hypothetical protein FRB93_005775 [Tulasnella sp. JGI-2019a]